MPADHPLDGASLLCLLRAPAGQRGAGCPAGGWRKILDLEHDVCYNATIHWNALLTRDDPEMGSGLLKYIWHASPGAVLPFEQLFNLSHDPHEQVDLARTAGEAVLERWRRRLATQWQEEGRGAAWFDAATMRPLPRNVTQLYSPHFPRRKTDDGPFHVAYSSRLPDNAVGGPGGHGPAPGGKCFANSNAFGAAQLNWAGKHIPACNVTDAPVSLPNNGTYCYTSPQEIKQCLDAVPAGRRALHLQGGIFLQAPARAKGSSCGAWGDVDAAYSRGCSLWADKWKRIVSKRFDEWFARLKALGGSVDVIMLDFEGQPYWEWQHYANDSNTLQADPRWPAVREELNSKGRLFGVSFDDLSDMHSWGMDSSDFRQFVWADVMLSRRGRYLNETLFDPARKSFPQVKGSDYDHSHHPAPGKQWAFAAGGVTKQPLCCGSHVGTHGSRAYYGWSTSQKPTIAWTAPASKNGKVAAMNVSAPNTPFNMMLHYIRQIRGELLSVPGVGMMPWVQPKNSSWYSKLCHTAACSNHSTLSLDGTWEEMLFHMALNGVSEFLWYRAGDEFVTEGIKNFTAVLVELDEVVARHTTLADAHCAGESVTFADESLLSGIRAAQGSVYRFSPRAPMAEVSVVSENPATFRIGGREVAPVKGGVLQKRASVGTNGFWIATTETST